LTAGTLTYTRLVGNPSLEARMGQHACIEDGRLADVDRQNQRPVA